ncbi:response regulator [bacterium]|jgi:DNA-binding NarL/FixJ family response regulator|nr:response regulator [Planctomycetota bacterium]MDC1043622.1 response regulator [bacterium]
MSRPAKARVLLVDDEPLVSSGLRRMHQQSFDFVCASSPEEAFERLEADGPFAVVVSDYQMPKVNGAEFLSEVAERYPDTSRVMLTGQGNLETAVEAVNRGSIFRFLMKPCDPALFRKVVSDAAEQYRLRRAERDLMRNTVKGAVEVLVEVMALNNPAAFGRSRRVQRLVAAAARELGLESTWELETASLLSQLGFVAIPDVVVERAATGQPLTADQERMLEGHPELACRLVAKIPRLQTVAAMIAPGAASDGTADVAVQVAARLLRAATDYEELIALGAEPQQAQAALADPTRGHDARTVHAVATAGAELHRSTLQAVPIAKLQTGMILAEDLRAMGGGQVILKRGVELSESSLQRLRNYSAAGLLQTESVRVFLRGRTAAADAAVAA